MNFKKYLQLSSEEITTYAGGFFTEWLKEPKNNIPQIEKLQNLFAERMIGGKMVRGTLVMLGYALQGQTDSRKILHPALAIEILHSSLLIHDDIMDVSQTRRGKPAVYRALGGSQHGVAQAICLGDLGFFLAMQLMTESDFALARKNEAIAALSQTITQTVFGQMLDEELSQKILVKEKDVLTQYKLKTAYYSVVSPLSIGGILGGASSSWLRSVEKFGEYLGIAYQIQDDILGVFGDDTVMGKSTSSDIEEGKRTILFSHCLTHASSKQKKLLKEIYGTGKITKKEQRTIQELFVQSGSLAYAVSLSHEYGQKAHAYIPSLTQDKKMQSLFSSLIEIVIKRSR